MYKADIAAELVEMGSFSKKEATIAVEEIFGVIQDNLANGEDVTITGFGKFTTADKPATTRKVFKEVRDIPAHTVVRFKPGKSLRDAVNA